MRFKNFTIGKSKDKTETKEAENTTAGKIAEMEEKINGRTKNLEETAQQLQGLSGETTAEEDVDAKPHGPLSELTIEPEDKLAESDDFIAEVDTSDEDGEEIKVVEVNADSVPPLEAEGEEKTETKKEAKPEDTADSLNNLFSDDEEEENPLANLINSLPDVTVEELMVDLNEIKGIINEWQQR